MSRKATITKHSKLIESVQELEDRRDELTEYIYEKSVALQLKAEQELEADNTMHEALQNKIAKTREKLYDLEERHPWLMDDVSE